MMQPEESSDIPSTETGAERVAAALDAHAAGTPAETWLPRGTESPSSVSPAARGLAAGSAASGARWRGGQGHGSGLAAPEIDAILGSIEDGVLVFDRRSGSLRIANTAAAVVLGQPLGATFAVSEYPSQCGLFHPDGRAFRAEDLGLTAVWSEGLEHLRQEAIVRRSDGSCGRVLATTTAIRDANRGVAGAVHILHDVTRVREMETWAHELLSSVSHDLKNPLTAIKGFTSLVLRKGAYDEAFLVAAMEQCERLHGMIELLVEESRLAMGRFTLSKGRVDVSP